MIWELNMPVIVMNTNLYEGSEYVHFSCRVLSFFLYFFFRRLLP